MSKRVLVTGGQGLLARYLSAELGRRALCLSRQELDITDRAAIEARLGRNDVDWVINCAGTARGPLESQLRTNALAVRDMAQACAAHNVGLVYISTARVFGHGDGPFAENAPPCPVDDYGLSKYLGEQLVARELQGGRYRIVRVSMTLGLNPRAPYGQLLPRLLQQTESDEPVRAATDLRTSVVHGACVARLLAASLSADMANGVYHVASRDMASLYDLASHVFYGLGVKRAPAAARAADFHGAGLAPPAAQGLRSTAWPTCGGCLDAAERFVEEWRAFRHGAAITPGSQG